MNKKQVWQLGNIMMGFVVTKSFDVEILIKQMLQGTEYADSKLEKDRILEITNNMSEGESFISYDLKLSRLEDLEWK